MSAPADDLAIGVHAALHNCADYLRDEIGLTAAADQIVAVEVAVSELVRQANAAERFIAGFEGDELQDGVDELLASLRASIARIDGASIAKAAGEQGEYPHASEEHYVERLQR